MTPELQKQHENMDATAITLQLQELFEENARHERYKVSKTLFGSRMTKGTEVSLLVLKMIEHIERLETLGKGKSKGKGKAKAKPKSKLKGQGALKPKSGVGKGGKVICFYYGKLDHWRKHYKTFLASKKKSEASTSEPELGSHVTLTMGNPGQATASLVKLFESYRENPDVTINTLSFDMLGIVKGLGFDKKCDLALSVFEWFRSRKDCELVLNGRVIANSLHKDGIDIDVYAYTSLISAYASNGMYREAVMMFKKIEEEGCKPTLITYKVI
ncbi:pentatricopeptide repeat-containing protein At2g18940, chloroplastic-like [Pistacia vera]|uniref:pentatricopeptide repeat-containing protein At2g18940, chloroplastic-like n=1 Tax=Pistacia vera TaxID=55513 RepID=UPI0012635B98|nr:pentatricopeptide repeat-containing protein At2g18940, chloroplastic-like [Pistacia vera]